MPIQPNMPPQGAPKPPQLEANAKPPVSSKEIESAAATGEVKKASAEGSVFDMVASEKDVNVDDFYKNITQDLEISMTTEDDLSDRVSDSWSDKGSRYEKHENSDGSYSIVSKPKGFLGIGTKDGHTTIQDFDKDGNLIQESVQDAKNGNYFTLYGENGKPELTLGKGTQGNASSGITLREYNDNGTYRQIAIVSHEEKSGETNQRSEITYGKLEGENTTKALTEKEYNKENDIR